MNLYNKIWQCVEIGCYFKPHNICFNISGIIVFEMHSCRIPPYNCKSTLLLCISSLLPTAFLLSTHTIIDIAKKTYPLYCTFLHIWIPKVPEIHQRAYVVLCSIIQAYVNLTEEDLIKIRHFSWIYSEKLCEN